MKKEKTKLEKIPNYDFLFIDDNKKRNGKDSGVLKKILKLNTGGLITSGFLYLLQAIPVWITPLLTANIVNIVTGFLTDNIGTVQGVIQTIIINALVIAVCLFTNVPTTVLKWRVVSKISRRTSAGIKSSVIRKLQKLSISYHKEVESGRLQSKFIKDTEAIDGLITNIFNGLVPCLIMIVVSSVLAVCTNEKGWIISLFFVVVVPANVTLTRLFRKKIKGSHRKYRLETEGLSGKMSTMLEMMPVTKSHGLEQTEIASLNKNIGGLLDSGLKLDRTIARFGSWMYVVNELLSASCVIFCVFLALDGTIGVGDIILYQSLFKQITGAVSGVANLMPTIAAGKEALYSISEIMNATDVEDCSNKERIGSINGDLEFQKVSYHYPDGQEGVLQDFSLSVKSGECVAVVGASGSGKSTLMNLIIGLMFPTDGKILIDGKDISEINLTDYRKNISVVPQNSILFSGTIRENIVYGLESYTNEQLEQVMEMANVKEFLDQLPNGLDTLIGEHGTKLSGGQKQRVTIARALIRNPKLLILDEATSSLDNISEYHVQKAISSSVKGKTTFIVAHRLSTIRNADKIVVLKQGRIVEIGTYSELLENKGEFYKLKELNEINLKKAQENLE